LTELSAANLLSEHTPGRYSFHDLLRAYASELAEDHETVDDRAAARQRMFDHYLHTADRADHLLYPHRDPVVLPTPPPGTTDERLDDPNQALAWFSREGPVLLAVARLAESLGHSTFPGYLTWTMVNFLDRRGLWPDWIDVQAGALRAAVRASDLSGQATAHRGLEHAYFQLGRYDDADRHGHCAVELYQRLDDRAGEAQTHLALGASAARRGDLTAALTFSLRACTLYESVGHQAGRANALNNAGMVRTLLGDFDEAVALCEEAVEIQQAVGDRYMLGTTWDSLGYAHQHLGHHEQAISCYRNALELIREQGGRYFEAETLTHLGDTHALAGDDRSARDAWQAAVGIYEELGHPDAETTRAKLTAPSA
jgi:tetratricopeptide (TPR) repeat protein